MFAAIRRKRIVRFSFIGAYCMSLMAGRQAEGVEREEWEGWQ